MHTFLIEKCVKIEGGTTEMESIALPAFPHSNQNVNEIQIGARANNN